MRYFIGSDIHGSAYYEKAMMAAFEREKAEYILLLGDLLYHGARNDLPKEYAPKEVTADLNAKKDKIFCVRGNCESEVDQMVLEFPVLTESLLMEQNGHLLYITHGHHHHLKNLPPLRVGDILLHGHTHVPAWENNNGIYYFNPGSISMPKEDSCHSYMVMEDGNFYWKELFSGDTYHKEKIE